MAALTWPAMVVAVQAAGPRVLAGNEALAELAHVERKTLAGRALADLTPLLPKDLARLLPDQLALVLKTGAAQSGECDAPEADAHLQVLVSPLRGADGTIAGVLIAATPTRALRRAEETMRAARDVAEAAQRARSAFVANVSHEIRTPIHAILGFADLLAGIVNTAPQREHVDSIREAGGVLLSLLQDVIDLARLEGGALTLHESSMDAREVVNKAIHMHAQSAAAKRLSLTGVVAPDVPVVLGDSLRLTQVLSNLIANAIKFTSSGTVRVDVTASKRTTRDCALVFDVTDTGAGIADDARARIFERFVQLDDGVGRRAGGAGLGLSIARELVEHMGGTIEVSSVPGKGSCFRVTLTDRLISAKTEVLEPRTSTLPEPISDDARTMRVMIVEDNTVNQRLMLKMLDVFGLKADVEGDGQQAIERSHAERYDLILMDVAMPDIDGLRATRLIRAEGQGRPWIVGVSARVLTGDREAGIAAGMDEYLTKPASLDALRGAIVRAASMRARARGGKRP